MNTNRALSIGIALSLLSAGYPLVADASQDRQAPAGRDGIVNRLEPQLVPVPTAPARGVVRVWTSGGEGSVFYPGENMEIFFRTNRDAFVVVVDIDTRGRARLLFPTRSRDDGFVEAGRTMTLPGRRAGYRLMVTGPAGIERIVAFASDLPIADEWEDLLADDLGCLGCAEAPDFHGRSGNAWSASLAIDGGSARIELAGGSSKPRIVRGDLDPQLVPVPIAPYFLDRDETWFRVARGPRYRW